MIKPALYILRLSSFLIPLLCTLFNPSFVFSSELPITCESVLHQENVLVTRLFISISQKQLKTWERPLENMWLYSIALIRWTSEDLAEFTKVHLLLNSYNGVCFNWMLWRKNQSNYFLFKAGNVGQDKWIKYSESRVLSLLDMKTLCGLQPIRVQSSPPLGWE